MRGAREVLAHVWSAPRVLSIFRIFIAMSEEVKLPEGGLAMTLSFNPQRCVSNESAMVLASDGNVPLVFSIDLVLLRSRLNIEAGDHATSIDCWRDVIENAC